MAKKVPYARRPVVKYRKVTKRQGTNEVPAYAYPGLHGGRGPQAEGDEVALPRDPRQRHLNQAIGEVSETVQRGSNINLCFFLQVAV